MVTSSVSTLEPTRIRVLLLAYSISPVRGSEYSVGWNHVRYLSEFCDITVLYGLAGPHMGDFAEIEEYLRTHGEIPNVKFIPIRPNFVARVLNYPNRKGVFVYSFYLAYRVWHWQVANRVRKLFKSQSYDLIHYLCPIGYREPGYLWTLGKPYIWGPICGMVPARVLEGAPRSKLSVAKTRMKNFLNALQLHNSRRLGRALRKANQVISATTETSDIILRRFGIVAQHIPENAIPDNWPMNEKAQYPTELDSPIQFVWIGRLDNNKSPDLLIAALARVGAKNWHLNLVGDGPLEQTIRSMITANDLSSNITLHGSIPRQRVIRILGQSDLHILTSMSEANTTVIWEAMASGVPTLTLDHCGMHDTVCDQSGIRVAISDYAETRDKITSEIQRLIAAPEILANLAKGTVERRSKYLWSDRAQSWLNVYQTVIVSSGSNTADRTKT